MQSTDLGRFGPTTLNGITPVQICPAPASGFKREVVGIATTNLDTLSVTPILQFDVSGTKTEIDRSPLLTPGATDKTMASVNNPHHLTGTTDSLYMKLAAAITTNNPTVMVYFKETTDDA